MKVLLTSHRAWPSVGGTEEVVTQLAARMARRGHDVTVATSDEEGRPPDEPRQGFALRRFPMKRVGKFRFPPSDYVPYVRDGDWDVVHVHGQRVWSTDYLYPHFARVRAPLVFTAHGFYQWHVERTPLVDAAYYRVLLPRVLRHAAAVTALTSNEKQELHGWGVPLERLHLIPDGFDVDEFRQEGEGFRRRHGLQDGPFLLYVGGLYRNKRVDRLVRAAARAGAPLAIVGRDAHGERAALESLAGREGADVRFFGKLPRGDVLAAYREATLFLLGSAFEGFGLVLLEAMASGLPFVATRAGAAPDLAARGGGVSVAPEALAEEAWRLLLDDDARRAMRKTAREAAQHYDWERIVDQYERLYEEVARR